MAAQQRKSCSVPGQVSVEAAHTTPKDPCALDAVLLAAKQRYKNHKQPFRHERLGTGDDSTPPH